MNMTDIDNIGLGRPPVGQPANQEVVLQVLGLSKRFGGLQAVSDVSFSILRGQATAIIGPNGAGKTTVFNLITNLLTPSAGKVFVSGVSVNGMPSSEIAKLGLIRTFQSARVFPGMTTLENAMAGAHRLLGKSSYWNGLWMRSARKAERHLAAKARNLLDVAGILEFENKAATDLPMGAQKKLEVIRALMAEPTVLLLDEPAAGLNDSETEELSDLLCAIRELGITLVVVDHNMSLVMKVAQKIIVIDAGKVIADGKPDEVRSNPRVIEAYMGMEAD
jgi:branched-chain amino acid transport system ATP-binding protein